MQLAKEIAGSVKEYKVQSFFALRCLSVLADKITQTTAMEDRRIRKEFQVKIQPSLLDFETHTQWHARTRMPSF
jgi:hypothetical protein